MRVNILVLSYIEDLETWKKRTLDFVNNAVRQDEVFVTLLLVRSSVKKTNIEQLLDKRVELRPVTLATKAKSETPCLDLFFEPKNSALILGQLEEILVEKTYDFIQVESVVFLQFIDNMRSLSEAKIVYRQYEVESEKLSGQAKSLRFSVFKYFSLSRVINKIKALEEVYPKLDYIFTSEPSQVLSRNDVKFFILPSDVDFNIPRSPVDRGFKLFFVGDLTFIPIQHSILWFLNETWEKLSGTIEGVEFHIAGRSEPWFSELISKRDGVFYYPGVEDYSDFLKDKTILLLPYDTPLGILPEYLQAMQAGKIIVANSNAVCCWGLTAMIHYMPAKESVKFIEVLDHIYQKAEIRQYFSDQIFNFASQNIDKSYLTKVILRLYFRFLTQKI